MKLPIELENDLNELKEKFKRKGYELKEVKINKIEYDFYELMNGYKKIRKMKNEDHRPFEYNNDVNMLF